MRGLNNIGLGLSPRLRTNNIIQPIAPSAGSPEFWHDAADTDPANIGQTSNLVLTLADKSANNRFYQQVTGSSQPATNGTQINGKNTLVFNGSSSWMQMQNQPGNIAMGPNTLYMVLKRNAVGDHMFLGGHSGGSAFWGMLSTTFGRDALWLNGGGFNPGGNILNSTTLFLLVLRRQGTTLDCIVNGVKYTATNASDVSLPNSFSLGREEAAGGRKYFNGLFCEDCAYQSAHSNAEINGRALYFINKWGAPWTNL
ncbi:hypothetical protein [Methylobacterium sp. 1030]|uniref:hypothetical protein n=1 Tax=Methylobacterium sp. 1030 TaxID=3156404 RepID=UPI003396F02B